MNIESRIKLIKGDITKLSVDAIVNAANTSLLGGGGVDGAIHRAAGPELLAECKTLNGCPVGKAKLTKGYNLRAKFVIHTVGPIWKNGQDNEEKFLANCYKSSLKIASHNNIHTVAFPSISTGAYGFPIKKAVAIAVREVKKFLLNSDVIEQVIFVTFSDYDYVTYKNTINNMDIDDTIYKK